MGTTVRVRARDTDVELTAHGAGLMATSASVRLSLHEVEELPPLLKAAATAVADAEIAALNEQLKASAEGGDDL